MGLCYNRHDTQLDITGKITMQHDILWRKVPNARVPGSRAAGEKPCRWGRLCQAVRQLSVRATLTHWRPKSVRLILKQIMVPLICSDFRVDNDQVKFRMVS